MKKLRVMDSSGDTVLEFNETDAEASATKEAQALFERMTKNSAAVFAVNRGGGQLDKRVTNFNELEQDNVIVPRIVSPVPSESGGGVCPHPGATITPAMLAAGVRVLQDSGHGQYDLEPLDRVLVRQIFEAMVNASEGS